MEKRIFNRTEAADYLGVDRHTLIKWEGENYGPKPARVPSGRPYYSRESLDAFVASFANSTQGASFSVDRLKA